jgi:hypothetical protein
MLLHSGEGSKILELENQGEGMKTVYVAALLLLLGTVAFASEPKAKDFDTSFLVDVFGYETANDCWMKLTAGDTTYAVRWHYNQQQIRSSCPEHRSGEHWQGRAKGGMSGYRIELLSVNSKGKPAVETWYITSKVQ